MSNTELNVQVLVAAMHQNDHSLPEKMNIQTDAVIGNQCDRCSNEAFSYEGRNILYLNRPDRGVGLNRNETLLHSGEGILTFADDDMSFADGYEAIIQKAFTELPDADGIIFNIETKGGDMQRRINGKSERLHFYNALNYGAARLSVRACSIKRENIFFHTCFGGGTIYSSGEDTIFITDMLKHGLKLYTYPVYIASVDQSTSTWFNGYNKKLLHDKGAVFRAISRFWAKPLCLQELLRHKNTYKDASLSFSQAYGVMKEGIKDYMSLTASNEAE